MRLIDNINLRYSTAIYVGIDPSSSGEFVHLFLLSIFDLYHLVNNTFKGSHDTQL